MASNGREPASFLTQADALFRKILTFQRRNIKQNITLTIFPALLCLLIITIQAVVNSQLNSPKYRCGCRCIDRDGSGTCHNVCGLEFSTSMQARACPVPRPQQWPALMQIPGAPYRAVRTDSRIHTNLPDSSCLKNLSCPVTSLFTGQNKTIAKNLVRRIALDAIPENVADLSDFVSLSYLGTNTNPGSNNFVEHAFSSHSTLHLILPNCLVNFSLTVPITMGNVTRQQEIDCVRSLYLWRENSSLVNIELFQGYRSGSPDHEIHEIFYAYDFLNSSESNFIVNLWYNSTYRKATMPHLLRIPRSLNMVSNAFLRHFRARENRILLSFVKEMPKPGNTMALNLSLMLGPLLYAWVIQLLLPVFLISLVYEKQHKLRIMMKVHGLGKGPYWVITYGYFSSISSLYMIWFAAFGYIIGLEIFRLNNYVIQFIFYLVYLNLQIALAFLAANGFSEVKTAAVVGYIYVFGSGLLGAFFFQYYIEDTTVLRWRVIIMGMLPGFSLYQGLYELSQYALAGHYRGNSGMSWEDLHDQDNGIKGNVVIMALEWLILLCISYYLDQVVYTTNGARRHPSFSSISLEKGNILPTDSSKILSSNIIHDHGNCTISEEICRVEYLLNEPSKNHPIICRKLEKVYAGQDGNSNRHAVHSISLAVPRGECFGMLGPNGSGKTTFINMVTGLLFPTSGTAFINNKDIRSDMDKISTRIGFCPQQDVIWETLTGREHLLFYGRLRNLKGSALQQAVDDSLKSLDLYEGNVDNQLARNYSGGMKRRLSVAISLIGDTKVVFLDEPSTGLDPESRKHLWRVIKSAKRDRAIILITHSMEEAEYLCDRLGIIVNGKLQCVGSSNELKTMYGRSYLLAISANPLYKKDIEHMVINLSPNAVKIYDIAGTLRFQLPKQDVRISDIFEAIENLKREIHVQAFGLATESLEDVFSKVVEQALDQIDQFF